jgi:hypothetical protein
MARQRATDQPLDPMRSGDRILDAPVLCRYGIVRPVLGAHLGGKRPRNPLGLGEGRAFKPPLWFLEPLALRHR